MENDIAVLIHFGVKKT